MRRKRALLLLGLLVLLNAGLWWAFREWDGGGPERATEPGIHVTDSAEFAGVAGADGTPRGDVDSIEDDTGSRTAASTEKISTRDEDTPGPAAIVRGRVVDPGGEPIEGALVLATNRYLQTIPIGVDGPRADGLAEECAQATTDANGEFAVTDGLIRSMGMSFAVFAPPFAPYRVTGQWLYPDGALDVGTLTMQPGVELCGRVEDEHHAAVGGATLLLAADSRTEGHFADLLGRGIVVGESAADGSFCVQGIPPGNWTLLADKPGHIPADTSGVAATPGSYAGASLVLRRGVAIEGHIEDLPADEVRPLRIVARPNQGSGSGSRRDRVADVGPGGAFRVEGLARDAPCSLFAQAQQDNGAWWTVHEVERRLITAPAEDVTLAYRRPCELRVRVVRAGSDEPVEAYSARLDERWLAANRAPGSMADGVLVATGDHLSHDDEQTLVIQSPGFATARRPVRLAPGQSIDLGNIELEPGPAVNVQVRDRHSGEPVAGAQLLLSSDPFHRLDLRAEIPTSRRASNTRRYQQTSAAGTAQFVPLERAPSNLVVFAEGYTPVERVLDIEPSSHQSVDVHVELDEGAKLVLRVVDEDEKPLEGVIVELQRAGAAYPLHATSSFDDGLATFEDLVPDEYRVRSRVETWSYRDDGYDSSAAWQRVTVAPGIVTEATLVSGGFYDFGGCITAGGRPLSGATLSLSPDDPGASRRAQASTPRNSRFQVRTRADGQFEFYVINEGPYSLLVQHPSRHMRAVVPIVVRAGMDPLALDLSSCAVKGRIVDREGRAVEGNVGLTAEPTTDRSGNRITFDARLFRTIYTTPGDHPHGVLIHEPVRREFLADGAWRFDGVAPERPLTLSLRGPFTAPQTLAIEPLRFDELRTVQWTVDVGSQLDILVAGEPDDMSRWAETKSLELRGALLDRDGRPREGHGFQRVLERGRTIIEGCPPGRWRVALVRVEDGGAVEVEQHTVDARLREKCRVEFARP